MQNLESSVDETDRLIAAALQVNGRASWGEISRVLELPERTVARRGQRLLDAGIVRISTYVDPMRVLHARALLLRVTTTPACVWSVANALACRPDASSVSVLEGSGSLASMLLPRDMAAVRRALFSEIPAIQGIVTIEATTVLKFFRSGHDWHPQVLDENLVQELDDAFHVEVDSGEPLTPDEEDLIALLLADGRKPATQLAADLGLSVATVRRRMESLARRGLVHPRTEVLPRAFGLGLEALVWLRVPMRDVDKVGAALASAPEVKFIAATTGTSQLIANVLVADESEFYTFLTGSAVADHAGVEVVESLVVITPVLRGSLHVDESKEIDMHG